MPDWKSKESHARLLAAVVAATPDMKLDYRRIASMYGEGATYDSIEGRFRVIKKEAAVMKSEIENGVRSEAPIRGNPFGTPKKNRSPKKAASTEGVRNGRVTKSASSTPTKKNTDVSSKPSLVGSLGSSYTTEIVTPSDLGSFQESFCGSVGQPSLGELNSTNSVVNSDGSTYSLSDYSGTYDYGWENLAV